MDNPAPRWQNSRDDRVLRRADYDRPPRDGGITRVQTSGTATRPERRVFCSAEPADDFSEALAAFEREQAAEAAAVEAYGDKVVSGKVEKQTEKYLVVDVGLKSEGLIPLDQVLDHTGAVKFQPGNIMKSSSSARSPKAAPGQLREGPAPAHLGHH